MDQSLVEALRQEVARCINYYLTKSFSVTVRRELAERALTEENSYGEALDAVAESFFAESEHVGSVLRRPSNQGTWDRPGGTQEGPVE